MGNKTANSQISESRKIRKPIMEKKRRARINDSLEILKKILLECDPEQKCQKNVKLEKADILEMTVRYLQHLKMFPGMKKVSRCGEKVVQICPADSSTSNYKNNSYFKPAMPANCVKTGHTPCLPVNSSSKIVCGSLNARNCSPVGYNCGGVVYVVPHASKVFHGQVPRQPDRNPIENVWRPW